jgi:hypothetical protein
VVFVPPALPQDDRELIREVVTGLDQIGSGIVEAPEVDGIVIFRHWVGLPLMAFEHLSAAKQAFLEHTEEKLLFLFEDLWEKYMEKHVPLPEPPRSTDFEQAPEAEVPLIAIGSGLLQQEVAPMENGRFVFCYKPPDSPFKLRLIGDSLEEVIQKACSDSHIASFRRLLAQLQQTVDRSELERAFQAAINKYGSPWDSRFAELYRRYF